MTLPSSPGATSTSSSITAPSSPSCRVATVPSMGCCGSMCRGPARAAASRSCSSRSPLLADDKGFLAQDALLNFCPVRRLGRAKTAAPLDDYRLGLAFMASAPRGQRVLDYEAEGERDPPCGGEGDIDLL